MKGSLIIVGFFVLELFVGYITLFHTTLHKVS